MSVPDHPGAFASVAQALGGAGGNIVTFEIVESGAGRAIDQLLVDLPAGVATQVLETLARTPDVEVETFQPIPRRPTFEGPLELFQSLVDVAPADVLQVLADGVPDAMRASWAVALASRQPQPRPLAASAGAPSLVGADLPWLPLGAGRVLPVEDWIPARWGLVPGQAQLAAAPLTNTGDAALLAVRKRGPAFRHRELRVLAALALVGGRLAQPTPI